MPKTTYLVLCVMAASLSTISAMSDAEKSVFRDAIAPIITECSTTHGVSQSEIEAAKKANNADDIKPCFIGCVMKKMELIDSKGQYNPEKGIASFKKFISSEADIAKFEEIAQKCLKVNDEAVSDGDAGCDRAKLVVTCAIEQKADFPL